MRQRLQRVCIWSEKVRASQVGQAGAIFLLFSCVYILTSQGRTNSYDGQSMFATTRSLAQHGTLAISSVSASAFGTRGRGGLFYSKYGIGQSLAELPLYYLGKLAGWLAGAKAAEIAEAVAMLTNPLIMAATCAVFYGIVRRLGYRRATAVWATLALGIATSFWPYSKSDFSEPLLALSLAVAVLCALWASQILSSPRESENRTAKLEVLSLDLVTGAALGVAVLTKYAAVIYLPVFVLLIILSVPTVPPSELQRPTSIHLSLRLERLTALLAPVILAGILVLLVDALRFGSVWSTGYAPSDRPFSGSILVGLPGLLISPTSGIFLYDPLLFAGLLAIPVLLRSRPSEALLTLGLVGGSLVFYASYRTWSGGSAWGPRYLVPILPYLMLPLLALGCFGSQEKAHDRIAEHMWRRRLIRGTTLALAFVSVVAQFIGVCVNYLMEDAYWLLSSHHLGDVTGSLRASRLALSVWALRLSLHYAFLRSFASGYSSAQYPFAPPFPPAPHMPEGGGVFPLQYFWFTLTPKPILAFSLGAIVLGSGMVLAAWLLRYDGKSLVRGDGEHNPGSRHLDKGQR